MLLLRRPTAETIRDFLATPARLDLTYSAIGTTTTSPPPGYVVDHTRIKLGEGEARFAAAKAALERWDHFRLGWVQSCPPNTPIKIGQVVAVLARCLGLWCLNACRIVYVVDEDGPVKRFGFAYPCSTRSLSALLASLGVQVAEFVLPALWHHDGRQLQAAAGHG